MEFAWNQYYSIPKRMLLFAGQWPYQEKRTRFFRVSLLTVTTFSMIVPQVAEKFLIKFFSSLFAILVLNLIVNKLKKLIKI